MIAALNKHWRPLTKEELDQMSIEEIEDAIAVAGFNDKVKEWIWKPKRNLGDIF